MQNRKKLDSDMKMTGSLKGLAQAYEQISVTKMQRVRGKVLSSRDYLTELSIVFGSVKSSYRLEIDKFLNKKRKKGILQLSPFGGNGRNISILLSSNGKLYGDIGQKVFNFFMDSVQKENSDIYIIGKIGRELFINSGVRKKYGYIDFPDELEEEAGLKDFFKDLLQYETVNVFHGQFQNVLTQKPLVSNVSGTQGLTADGTPAKNIKFFFEPSLEEVLELFEDQIFASLFKQTLHESELSHVASRIKQMENALENIGEYEKKLARIKKRVHKRVEGAKQIQRMAGMRLWK